MRGRAVFQPFGFDSFGIHAENYALAVGEHPARLTSRTVANYRRQLRRFGAAWDWSREVVTSDPAYYRWTQWLFVQLFRAGLAYRADAPVQWCPSCATVLANEQVEGGRCERCANEVVERVLRQWFLRITAYADRLLDGLDRLDWPERAKNAQRAWIGRGVGPDGKARYRLRDWLISRQRYWGPPIPVVHCDACGSVAVPEEELPVLLPDVEDVRPPGDGRSPLAAVPDFVAATCPSCARPARRETDVSDNFLDSAWYFLRYPCTDLDDRPFDPGRLARAMPVDLYWGGPEHVARHHLYARFVTMALHDLGFVPFEEPFPTLRLHGIITKDGRRMSKSRGNVVDPDEWADRYGADVVRLALLHAGRFEKGGDVSHQRVTGVERFRDRAWRLLAAPPPDGPGGVDLGPLHGAVAAVDRDLGRLSFNTAVTALIGLVRWAGRERDRFDPAEWAAVWSTTVRLLAPFAPHLTEELWHGGGGTESVHGQPWPGEPLSP